LAQVEIAEHLPTSTFKLLQFTILIRLLSVPVFRMIGGIFSDMKSNGSESEDADLAGGHGIPRYQDGNSAGLVEGDSYQPPMYARGGFFGIGSDGVGRRIKTIDKMPDKIDGQSPLDMTTEDWQKKIEDGGGTFIQIRN